MPIAMFVQICHEFERFSVYLTGVKVANFFGGMPMKQQVQMLKDSAPNVVVGTPGRLKQVSHCHFTSIIEDYCSRCDRGAYLLSSSC